jgi:outer membrane biogenesis lipoprotein LolB
MKNKTLFTVSALAGALLFSGCAKKQKPQLNHLLQQQKSVW